MFREAASSSCFLNVLGGKYLIAWNTHTMAVHAS